MSQAIWFPQISWHSKVLELPWQTTSNVDLDLITGTCNNKESVDLRLYFDVCLLSRSCR